MRRAFDLDVLAGPRCGGRLRGLATVQDPIAVPAILAHRARAAAAEPPGPAPPAPAAITSPRRSTPSLTLAGAAPTPGAAPLCALLDREPAPAQDGSGLAGDHAADARLRPLEPALPGPAPGFARETGLGRTPAAPAEVAL